MNVTLSLNEKMIELDCLWSGEYDCISITIEARSGPLLPGLLPLWWNVALESGTDSWLSSGEHSADFVTRTWRFSGAELEAAVDEALEFASALDAFREDDQ